jgi:hypothetical protein
MAVMSVPYQPPAQQGVGRLVIDSSYASGSIMMATTGPTIEINGQAVRANWGPWSIDLVAGNYHVYVYTRYLGETGPAQLNVTVYPGQQVTVFYRSPVAGMRGAIGFTPQKTPGMATMLVIIGVISLFLLIMLIRLLSM